MGMGAVASAPIVIGMPDGRGCNPVGKVYKRFTNGPEENIAWIYHVMAEVPPEKLWREEIDGRDAVGQRDAPDEVRDGKTTAALAGDLGVERWADVRMERGMGRQIIGEVNVYRFAVGGSFSIVRKHDLPECVHEGQGESLAAMAGDFLVQGFRRGPNGYGYGIDTPVVVQAREHEARLWATVVPLLRRYREPAPNRCRYQTPEWSLEDAGASIHALRGKTIEVSGMRRIDRSAFASEGACFVLPAIASAEEFTAAILKGMTSKPAVRP